jgi:hypothetical protein
MITNHHFTKTKAKDKTGKKSTGISIYRNIEIDIHLPTNGNVYRWNYVTNQWRGGRDLSKPRLLCILSLPW